MTHSSNILAFRPREKQDPHITGDARCISCEYEWVAVAPVGAVWLECPACGSRKGLMRFACERDGLQWTCGCDNTLFHVTPDGIYCPNCGEYQQGFDNA